MLGACTWLLAQESLLAVPRIKPSQKLQDKSFTRFFNSSYVYYLSSSVNFSPVWQEEVISDPQGINFNSPKNILPYFLKLLNLRYMDIWDELIVGEVASTLSKFAIVPSTEAGASSRTPLYCDNPTCLHSLPVTLNKIPPFTNWYFRIEDKFYHNTASLLFPNILLDTKVYSL